MKLTCPLFNECGGCSFLDISSEEQLHLKENEMELLFSPVLEKHSPALAFKDVYKGAVPSPDPYYYRNKMEFSFGDAVKDGPLTLGLHKKKSFYSVLTADSCVLAHPDFNEILKATLSFFSERKIPYVRKKSHEGILRHLLIRRGRNTGEILVDLVTTTQGGPAFDELLPLWCDRLLSLPLENRIVSILHTKNDSLADAVIDEGTEVLYGSSSFHDTVLSLSFEISPFSFFQTNTKGAEELYSHVRELAKNALSDKNGLIYDLYCGTGTITQLMSPSATKVVGVEIVEEAVNKARINAKENGIENVSFIASDVFDALDSLPEKPDLIILDPPREGVLKKSLDKILSYGVENIIYISCKPQSLARDLPFFFEQGYSPVSMKLFDMFPFTKNVEVVSLLQKMSNTRERTITLDVEMEDYYRLKNETEKA